MKSGSDSPEQMALDEEEGKEDQGVVSCLGWGRVELDKFQVQGRGITANRTGCTWVWGRVLFGTISAV